jgi:hypothetical protein
LASDISETQNLANARSEILLPLARKMAQQLESFGAVYPAYRTNQAECRPLLPAVAGVDTDQDGIEDRQEDKNANGLVDPGETNPDLSDTDGDGLKDGEELRAGTDPLDALSRLALVAAWDIPRNTLFLSWPSHSNAVYQVQTNPTLAANSWTVLADNLPGSERSTQFIVPAELKNQAVVFFRVLLK